MSSLNKILLIGNLTRDPEVKFTPSGKAVANFTVATSESWIKDGEKKERSEFTACTIWGKQAENCGQYLRKGSKVYVEGSLQTRSYESKEGIKKYITEVQVQQVKFLSPRPQENQGGGGGEQTTFDSFGGDEDPIPFASCSFLDSLPKEFTKKIA